MDYLDTLIDSSAYQWKSYGPDTSKLSYKGRWGSICISLKFGFAGEYVAIIFGPYTIETTLISYRIDGQDWQFTNVTTNASHLMVNPSTMGVNITAPSSPPQLQAFYKIIGNSLVSGIYPTLEGLSTFGYSWWHTSDTSCKATQIYGDKPEKWDFFKQESAGVVTDWPEAQTILVSLWNRVDADGSTYEQGGAFFSDICSIYQFSRRPNASNNSFYNPTTKNTYERHKSSQPFVHYFNATGILQNYDVESQ
ncbi:hypothetical protein BJ878DRAFT_547650 [Calycina marina]|uniref:Uncharacterized protein n=1 Tax=Calycina marina TaxID=1763456 RepID=A0A9P7Z4T2_9HELO|nr:hypothetical protein BJ878DRAFT_547650 [Calycina marina]